MKVEIVKEPGFSNKKCLKLVAENSVDEAALDDFFEEELNMGDLDFITDGEQTKSGFRDITLFKKK